MRQLTQRKHLCGLFLKILLKSTSRWDSRKEYQQLSSHLLEWCRILNIVEFESDALPCSTTRRRWNGIWKSIAWSSLKLNGMVCSGKQQIFTLGSLCQQTWNITGPFLLARWRERLYQRVEDKSHQHRKVAFLQEVFITFNSTAMPCFYFSQSLNFISPESAALNIHPSLFFTSLPISSYATMNIFKYPLFAQCFIIS